jgi:mannan endo-1,4-beta-mannosidase
MLARDLGRSVSSRLNNLLFAALAVGILCPACADASHPDDPPSAAPAIHALPEPPCTPKTTIGEEFVRRDGANLMLGDRRFQAVGANIYYLQQLFAEAEDGSPETAERALLTLDHAACLRLGVVRTVGFNDGAGRTAIRSEPGSYRESNLRALDRAVAEAKSRGLRLILPLGNNWPDYGGLERYAVWAGKQPQDRDTFFSDATMRQYWKDYAAMLTERVNVFTGIRYRDEPAILAWEIGNELRCETCQGTVQVSDTIRELASFLKTVAPNQLVGDGGAGLDDAVRAYSGISNTYWVRGAAGVSFSKLVEIEELDLVSYHMYLGPDHFQKPSDIEIWTDVHERIANEAGKVAYLGEFGLQALSNDADAERAAAFNQWLERLFAKDDGHLGLVWQLIPAARRGLGDEYGVVYDQDLATASVLNDWAVSVEPE